MSISYGIALAFSVLPKRNKFRCYEQLREDKDTVLVGRVIKTKARPEHFRDGSCSSGHYDISGIAYASNEASHCFGTSELEGGKEKKQRFCGV